MKSYPQQTSTERKIKGPLGWLIGLLIGFVAGLMSGLLGVGGGIVLVPLSTLFARFSQHQAHATSLAAIVPIALVSGATFAASSQVDYAIAAPLAVGAILGAPLGASLMARVREGMLKTLFGLLMVGVSINLLWP